MQAAVVRSLGDEVTINGCCAMGIVDDRFVVRSIGGQPTEVREPVLWISESDNAAAVLRERYTGKRVVHGDVQYVVVDVDSGQADSMVGLILRVVSA
jgi:hypothetical protein